MRFQPGHSGNPAGRPPGSRNKRTIIMEKRLDDSADDLTSAAIKLATAGDPVALRACLDRIAPRLRHRSFAFPLPELATHADVPVAFSAIAQGLAGGDLDVEEASVLMRAVREFEMARASVERQQRIPAVADAAPADEADASHQSLADFLASRTR